MPLRGGNMKILRVVSIILFISFLAIGCGSSGRDGDDSGNNNGGGGSIFAKLDMPQDDNGMAEVTVFDETFERGNGKPITENRTFIGVDGTATIKLMNDRISSALVTVNGQVIFDTSDFNPNVSYLEKEIMLLDGFNILDVLLRSKPGGKLSIQIIKKDTCVPANPPIEVCDGLDNDCDGNTDETGDSLCDNGLYCDGQETCGGTNGCQDGTPPCPSGVTCNESSDTCPVDCTDKDKDGYSVEGGSCGAVDCDDNNADTYPGAQEICDGKDNNCDGIFHDVEKDKDGDAYFPCEGDCNDNNNNINPGASEVCDGKDNDCDGNTDETGDSLCDNGIVL